MNFSDMGLSDKIALASLSVSFLLSLLAVIISLITLHKGNKNSSAATLLTLNSNFSQSWQRFFSADQFNRQQELADLLNNLEIASAIYLERSLVGYSREISGEYLDSVFSLLDNQSHLEKEINDLMDVPNVFKYQKIYRKKRGINNSITDSYYFRI